MANVSLPGASGIPTGSSGAPSAIAAAQSQIGVPYVWGGETAGQGFDCSGLLQWAFGKQGISIPRTTYAQFQTGTDVPESQLRPGDAVFFNGSDPMNGLPGHVAIYIGNGEVIQAPQTGQKVQVTTLSALSQEAGYRGARRYGPMPATVAAATNAATTVGTQAVPQKLGLARDATTPGLSSNAPPPGSRTQQVLTQLARHPRIDPRAAIAVAQQEGLGGGIGDGGTSFGPFQLHQGGAYPTWAPQGEQAAQQWAWSPAGINYALTKIAGVAAGQHGKQAVSSIVTGVERPANPQAEIARAQTAYGTAPGTAGASPRLAPLAAAAASGPHPVSPLIRLALQILNS